MTALFTSTAVLCGEYRSMLADHFASAMKSAVTAYKKATENGLQSDQEAAALKVAHLQEANLRYTRNIGTLCEERLCRYVQHSNEC